MLRQVSDLLFVQDILCLTMYAHWRLWRGGAADEVELSSAFFRSGTVECCGASLAR